MNIEELKTVSDIIQNLNLGAQSALLWYLGYCMGKFVIGILFGAGLSAAVFVLIRQGMQSVSFSARVAYVFGYVTPLSTNEALELLHLIRRLRKIYENEKLQSIEKEATK